MASYPDPMQIFINHADRVIPTEARIQKSSGFPRIKYGAAVGDKTIMGNYYSPFSKTTLSK